MVSQLIFSQRDQYTKFAPKTILQRSNQKFHLHRQRKMMKKSETGLGGREGAMTETYKKKFIDFYVRIFFQKINFHLLITH